MTIFISLAFYFITSAIRAIKSEFAVFVASIAGAGFLGVGQADRGTERMTRIVIFANCVSSEVAGCLMMAQSEILRSCFERQSHSNEFLDINYTITV